MKNTIDILRKKITMKMTFPKGDKNLGVLKLRVIANK